jgi:hypothetical protein
MKHHHQKSNFQIIGSFMTIISLTLTFVEIKILFLLAEREQILKCQSLTADSRIFSEKIIFFF